MSLVANVFDNDIIIVGQQPWDTDIGNNIKDIALELSKTNRVLFVNSPLNRITLLRGKKDPKVIRRLNIIKGKENGLVKVSNNLWNYYPDCIIESINWIVPVQLFNLLNRRNNRKFASSISKAIKYLGFKSPILFNDNEMFQGYYLNDFLKPKLSIYYVRDFMLAVDYWKKHGKVLEPRLISKSDLCLTNSEYLANYCKKYNVNSFNVGQGCDVDFFKKVTNIPEELKNVKKPIIGYVGALNSIRLDMDIIEHIAISYPEYTLVLVGAEDDEFRGSRLHHIKNILFLGQRPVESLPDFISAFDVCINPQLINDVTIGNYPRKIDEYLVLGKPIVAMHTITMGIFEDYVYLAKNKEHFVTLIRQSLEENNNERILTRKQFADTHTWEHSVKLMKEEVSSLLVRDSANPYNN